MNESFISSSNTGKAIRSGRRYSFLCMLAGVATLIALALGVTGARAQPGATDESGQLSAPASAPSACEWSVVPNPDVVGPYIYLYGVAVVSANDVWAVGNDSGNTLVVHWDGSAWSVVPSPRGGNTFLTGVAAVSANDVWAVGKVHNAKLETLVVHWDGSAWSVVPSPNVGLDDNHLFGVAAVSANDVWAVGNAGNETLVLHWDGSAWSVMPSPNPGVANHLYGIAAGSANDVWAVGDYIDSTDQSLRTLVIHWQNSTWSVMPSPNPGTANELHGVAAGSANDVWAVGYYYDSNLGSNHPLVMHYDGSTWGVVPSPSPLPNTDGNILRDVEVVGPNDVWAVGYSENSAFVEQTLVEHWDGSKWSVVSSPNVGSDINHLFGVAAVSANDVWAVGEYRPGNGTRRILVEHYSGDCGPPVSSPTPSATVSPVPPTATATPCVPGQFSDVPPDHTFYPYVSCLVDRGVMSGYADCTFRPSLNLTRGQLAKVVSNAANFTEPHTNQTFEDVATDHAFYLWIERLASRGIIGGYACGGENEPCVPPMNRPYFRSGANVTRGQTAKIVAVAAGLPAPSQGNWTFQDVPGNHTFWQWIEALSAAGAIGGYGCGGEGEPCVPPNNRPYFRVGNNVTRGQASKVVANAFFPNCQTR